MRYKVAVMGLPTTGGNYTFFQNLRNNIRGFDFHLVGIAGKNKIEFEEKDFYQIGGHLERESYTRELANSLRDFVVKQDFDILIPMNSPTCISIIPFLPASCRVIQRVNGDTPRVYKYVTSHADLTDKIICISQKQYDTILNINKKKNVDHKQLELIPHGVKPVNFLSAKVNNEVIRIGYIGRLHHGHKNILLIPEILNKVKVNYTFEFVGDGPDREPFVRKLEDIGIQYKDYGSIPNAEVNRVLQNWDILLFPSVTEGFGITLIEAMNVGVVPIANEINGVTDFIITHQQDGFIVKDNIISKYTEIISKLSRSNELLITLKRQAQNTVRARFDIEKVMKQYESIFWDVVSNKTPKESKTFSSWKPYVEYRPSILTRIFNLHKRIL